MDLERKHQTCRLRALTPAIVTVLAAAMMHGFAPRVDACDVCSIYIGTTKQAQRKGVFLAAAEQFTRFGTLQLDGETIPNFDNERVDSSITQFVLGYTFSRRAHVQVNVPFINRDYRRVTATGTESGKETGVGDIMLVGRYSVVQTVFPNSILNLDVVGGLKLPSGSTDRLGEDPIPVPEAAEARESSFSRQSIEGPRPHHDGETSISGVHGHDLTLGTGSVDGMIGTRLFTSYRRLFFAAGVQYMLRTEGDYKYHYANELQWNSSIGAYVLLNHDYTFALESWIHGETKGKDTQNGVRIDDTSVTALYIGPKARFSYRDRTNADFGIGFPVIQNTTDLQIVADWRIRAAWIWHF
jgi:hypothetical protein